MNLESVSRSHEFKFASYFSAIFRTEQQFMIPIKIFSLLFYSWFTLELTFAPPRNGKVILLQRFHEKTTITK